MLRLLTLLGIFRFSNPQIADTLGYISSPTETKLIPRNQNLFSF
jgi:hypothetical protein